MALSTKREGDLEVSLPPSRTLDRMLLTKDFALHISRARRHKSGFYWTWGEIVKVRSSGFTFKVRCSGAMHRIYVARNGHVALLDHHSIQADLAMRTMTEDSCRCIDLLEIISSQRRRKFITESGTLMKQASTLALRGGIRSKKISIPPDWQMILRTIHAVKNLRTNSWFRAGRYVREHPMQPRLTTEKEPGKPFCKIERYGDFICSAVSKLAYRRMVDWLRELGFPAEITQGHVSLERTSAPNLYISGFGNHPLHGSLDVTWPRLQRLGLHLTADHKAFIVGLWRGPTQWVVTADHKTWRGPIQWVAGIMEPKLVHNRWGADREQVELRHRFVPFDPETWTAKLEHTVHLYEETWAVCEAISTHLASKEKLDK